MSSTASMMEHSGNFREPIPRRESFLSRRQIEGMIAEGRTIIIVDRKVLRVDAWLKYHPGGEKSIMHMVGRDATDEINAFHSINARQQMLNFQIGKIKGRWRNFLPPIQGGHFRTYVEEKGKAEPDEYESSSSRGSTPPGSPIFDAIECLSQRKSAAMSSFHEVSSVSSLSSVEELVEERQKSKLSHLDAYTQQEINLDLQKYPPLDPVTQDNIVYQYRQLNDRIRKEGLYQCDYRSYLIELCRYIFFFSMCILCLRWGCYAIGGVFLGAFWHQLAFTAHDAGHMGITHNFTTDTVIGILIADFLGGLSLGWWKQNHNVHHLVTNSPEHDPDIEHMPVFAISHRFFESLKSSYYERIMTYDFIAKFVIQYQHYLYYPILTLGRFNLYRLSLEHLILGFGPRKGPAWWHRWLELVGQLFFWLWFGYGLVYRCIPTAGARFLFVMISHMITGPLHVQITLSHFAMSTADLGVNESFPQKMLRTTMDVDCPEWLDFVHGGLQFQAIHHLYPRIPRHNLRRVQRLVQEFCRDAGIPYALYGFVDGNKEVVGRLREVGRQAAILAHCQKILAENGSGSYH